MNVVIHCVLQKEKNIYKKKYRIGLIATISFLPRGCVKLRIKLQYVRSNMQILLYQHSFRNLGRACISENMRYNCKM